MAESIAEVAARFGVPQEKVEVVIEDPAVCRAFVMARNDPSLAPEQIMALEDLPTVDPSGLDVERIELTVAKKREIATNSRGDFIEGRMGHALVRGRMERAEKIAERRYEVILRAHRKLEQGEAGEALSALQHEIGRSIEQETGRRP